MAVFHLKYGSLANCCVALLTAECATQAELDQLSNPTLAFAADDYGDPGWFKHPEDSIAYEWTGQVPTPARAKNATAMTPRKQADFSGRSNG